MAIKRSIKTDMLVFLLGLIIISIIITAYSGVHSITEMGDKVQQSTSSVLRSQAERFLVQLTVSAAVKNDIILERVRKDTSNVAAYAKNIFDNPEAFSRDDYWRFDDHIFIGDGGKHMNSEDGITSVYIPNYVNIDDELKEDMELNAYLDLVFPKVLENDPNTVAIWTVGLQGESRYYPNIGLADVLADMGVPPDYDPTKDIFVMPATPENNPERKVVWSVLYDDPAGQGLMITAIAPIYTEKGFEGVVGIDVLLNDIIKNIEQYNPIEGSYFFLIDKEGYTIALPDEGYMDILGRERRPGEVRADLNDISTGFSPALDKMKAGSEGFESIDLGNKKVYMAYAPVEQAEFSLGIIVKEEVMLKAVSNLKKEVEESARSMIYRHILPAGLLILVIALIIGFLLINRIIKPIKRLEECAKRIRDGNLERKCEVRSKDEIGELARSFDEMRLGLKDRNDLLNSLLKTFRGKFGNIATILTRENVQKLVKRNPRIQRILPKSLGISIARAKKLHKEKERP